MLGDAMGIVVIKLTSALVAVLILKLTLGRNVRITLSSKEMFRRAITKYGVLSFILIFSGMLLTETMANLRLGQILYGALIGFFYFLLCILPEPD